MKRCKKQREKRDEPVKVSTHFIMKVIMPCVMLACKDEFKVKDPSKLDNLGKRIQHNINLIADKKVSEQQLAGLMTITEPQVAMIYFEEVVKGLGDTYEKQE